jgi:hypothetical protein
MTRSALFCLVLLLCPAPAAAGDWKPLCPGPEKETRRILECVVDTLSWVEVVFQEQNTNLAPHKPEMEKLIRDRFKASPLAYFRHEPLEYAQARKRFEPGAPDMELARRSLLVCRIWTVGSPDGYPVAYHVKTVLASYANLPDLTGTEKETLGVTSGAQLETEVSSVIVKHLGGICGGIADFLQSRAERGAAAEGTAAEWDAAAPADNGAGPENNETVPGGNGIGPEGSETAPEVNGIGPEPDTAPEGAPKQ